MINGNMISMRTIDHVFQVWIEYDRITGIKKLMILLDATKSTIFLLTFC